ncbi:unnamed protein product [Brassica oleracea]
MFISGKQHHFGIILVRFQLHLSSCYKTTLHTTEPPLFSTKIGSMTYNRFSQATSLSTATLWSEAYSASINLK